MGSSILEVACGCGFLAREFSENYQYVGIDYSESIVKKHKELFDHEIYVGESSSLQFENNSFDYVFCYGLFQYLPDINYAQQTIGEMFRVSRKGIFLGDLKNKKTRSTHFVFPRKNLENLGFSFLKPGNTLDDSERYSAFRRIQ